MDSISQYTVYRGTTRPFAATTPSVLVPDTRSPQTGHVRPDGSSVRSRPARWGIELDESGRCGLDPRGGGSVAIASILVHSQPRPCPSLPGIAGDAETPPATLPGRTHFRGVRTATREGICGASRPDRVFSRLSRSVLSVGWWRTTQGGGLLVGLSARTFSGMFETRILRTGEPIVPLPLLGSLGRPGVRGTARHGHEQGGATGTRVRRRSEWTAEHRLERYGYSGRDGSDGVGDRRSSHLPRVDPRR
jgi:hypothetical protein